MKRWFVAVLLLAAVVLLLSPGLIGLITERQVETHLQKTASAGSGQATTERFERHWFASEGLHRVPLDSPQLRELIQLLVPSAPPLLPPATLLIETEMQHGLLPAGSFVPALATGKSRVYVDSGGQRVELPGEISSRLSLDGGLTLRYPLPAGARQLDGHPVTLEGGELMLSSDATGRSFALELQLDDAAVDDDGERIHAGSVDLRLGGNATAYGFPVGETSLQITDLTVVSPRTPLSIPTLILDLRSGLEGERLNASFDTRTAYASADGEEFVLALRSGLSGLQADRLGSVVRRIRQGTVVGGDGALHPYFDADLRSLLSAGGQFAISELQLHTPQGLVSGELELSLPAAANDRAWPGLLLQAVGAAELSVPRDVVAIAATDNLQTLLAMGFLIPDGDYYRMNLQLESGRLTVNGAPLPLTQLLGSTP